MKLASPPLTQSANRKTERLEHRELIYAVVRDSMIRAGVLVASYKFKVLSLDVHGLQYIVMMDLVNRCAGDNGRLAEIEAMMAQTAKMRHNILVTGVYWRVNEPVTTGLSRSQTTPAPLTPAQAPELPATNLASLVRPGPRYEPLHQSEFEAFKRALAGATSAPPLSGSGQIVTSGRRNPTPPVEFEDTQLVDPDARASPLSATQYGDLN